MSQAEAAIAPDGPKGALLQSAVMALRARAFRVRWLAGEIADPLTSDRLLAYAAELEARAASEDAAELGIVPED